MADTSLPDFRLYHSNSLEVLAGLLAAELRQPVPGQALLAPETVLIPQVAMRRWLQAALAVEHGVAANLELLTPGEFVTRALDANIAPASDDLDVASLQWRIYAALRNPAVLCQPPLAALQAYLADADVLKPWALAGELASVFEKYQAWRGDWLLRWDAGADPQDPQALLWRHVAAGRGYRARRIHDYLAKVGQGRTARPMGLPARLFVFATLNVSPDVLRVLATQARVGTLHFYLPTPTQSYWGDLQVLRTRLRAGTIDPFGPDGADDNPLLQAWGAAGRDFMALLGSDEVVRPAGEIAAYADPEQRGGQSLDAGGLRDTLLHRMQADLFHRRPRPLAPLRATVRADDPSVQIHASHTRLRELQILHDQLRALFDDPRLDPPLQPREVAILAPDIDPYLPYLETVFSGPGHNAPIPYALADVSALAGEPLAQVFVRLLGLPVSRFGLNEVLDLLASPPLAEASGLDASAFERLHLWLQAAGVRWGLDARHRVQHQAPADDGYTWSFALDRLLLGHASGADADIAGVAAWPDLEGGALAALDVLIGLLRVLARYQRTLGEAMTPLAWRERLLGLLDALLPQIPAAIAMQRALDRLRGLIDAFARNAARAGFEAVVPAEVVRAHFTDVLGQADTRAPLLTGSVSVGRMVPMRLLPFRVICLLGMNDGDYPRRDPAAGLNRLTAELGTMRRRLGDRSIREDDRFLFLQLFAAAQDGFYLSYIGADPRDGSVREPSVLVSELIAAAAAYHADPQAAAANLVVRHPLQPFAPAAFGGDGDTRKFSYRHPWRPAAGRPGGARQALAPWCDRPLPAAPDPEPRLSLSSLRRFLLAPAETFLRHRLGLRLTGPVERLEDVEPLLLPGSGRARHQVQTQVFAALTAGQEAGVYRRLRARGLLPSGPLGERQLDSVLAQVRPYTEVFMQWRNGAAAQRQRLEVTVGKTQLHGCLDEVYPQGLARVRIGARNGPAAIRHGLDWLLASAAGCQWPLVHFDDAGAAGLGPHLRAPLPPDQACAALETLLRLRAQGLRAPLLFAPYSSWEFFVRGGDASAREAARMCWHGGARQWAEAGGEALSLALRGHDPFADAAAFTRFATLSNAVFGVLTMGAVGHGLHDVLETSA